MPLAEFHINLDPKEIDQMVTNAVLESKLGRHIKEAVEKAITDRRSGNSCSILEEAVRRVVDSVVVEVVERDFHDHIASAVKQSMTDEFIGSAVARSLEDVKKRLENKYF